MNFIFVCWRENIIAIFSTNIFYINFKSFSVLSNLFFTFEKSVYFIKDFTKKSFGQSKLFKAKAIKCWINNLK